MRVVSITEWKDAELVPTSALEYWLALQTGATGNDIVYDYSGNDRHITAASNPPTLEADVINGYLGMYFDGTKSPLRNTDDATLLNHIFIVASLDKAAFAGNEGLLSDTGTLPVLIGNGAAQTKFYNNTYVDTYRKNDTVYAVSNMAAPIGNNIALIEVVAQPGMSFNGFQIGQDRSDATRKWKGYFIEALAYSRVLTTAERRAVLLYFNLKFDLVSRGVPLWFPSHDITGLEYEYFDDEPEDFSKITEDFTYEDGGRDFNEKSDEAAMTWQVKPLALDVKRVLIFDEFWRRARLANTFYFRDKDSVWNPEKYSKVWSGVSIRDYNRKHKTKENLSQYKDVHFSLVKYPHSDVTLPVEYDYDLDAPTVPASLLGEPVSATQVYLLWTVSTDDTAVTGYELFIDGTTVADVGNTFYCVYGGLGVGSLHSFQVRAYDAAGNRSAWSSALFLTTWSGSDTDGSVLLFDGDYLTFDGDTVLF